MASSAQPAGSQRRHSPPCGWGSGSGSSAELSAHKLGVHAREGGAHGLAALGGQGQLDGGIEVQCVAAVEPDPPAGTQQEPIHMVIF